MNQKIFRAILQTALVVLFTSLVLTMTSLCGYFSERQGLHLRQELALAARGVELSGQTYLEDVESGACRLTWVDADGSVLYDTRGAADSMENHGGREEIQKALTAGEGSSSRMSAVLMRRTVYHAKRLSDGTVLRVSDSQVTALTLFLGMAQAISLLVIAAAAVSWVLANRLARQVVQPINALDLDDPLSNNVYEELSPLLRRIHRQNQQLKALRERSDELARITGHMNEGIALLNDKAVVLHLNPAARAIFHASNSCEGCALWELDCGSKLTRTVQAALETGRGELRELRDGREYQFNVSRVESEGEVTGAVVLAFVVTEAPGG